MASRRRQAQQAQGHQCGRGGLGDHRVAPQRLQAGDAKESDAKVSEFDVVGAGTAMLVKTAVSVESPV